MKYIDSEKLKAEIERLKEDALNYPFEEYGTAGTCDKLLSFIESQEQEPVDLEKEIDKFWNPRFNLGWDEKSLLSINHDGFKSIAYHFYELGRKSQSALPKIKGWVARDEYGYVHIFDVLPLRANRMWCPVSGFGNIVPDIWFSDLKWEDEPIEVELTIRKV